jgi:isoleucyl-tRNA synthetase
VDFVANEERTLRWWRDAGIVDRYLHRNDASPRRYSFIDGPITANNPMGVHHAWGRMYKDLFLRFRNMQGYRQRFQNGFDGQGLWVEVEVEKEKGFKSKRDIESYGVARFVEECKARVRHYAGVMTEQSRRLGYFMDWDPPFHSDEEERSGKAWSGSYHTMSDENNYTIWRFLKTCHERGWLYEGTDVMPWCPRCGTGLSQHEIVTEGYQELTHKSVYVKLPVAPGESLVVWTTTPWTLPANVAAAVNPAHTYVRVRYRGETLWLGKQRAQHVLGGDYDVLEERPGRELLGWRYSGPFDDLPAAAQARDQHRVIEWDAVGEEEGTGIVHIAPGAGAEDFQLGKREGLRVIAPLDEDGVYLTGYMIGFDTAGRRSPVVVPAEKPPFGELSGKPVAEVNALVLQSLRQKGVFLRMETITHRYPVCWRCDTELVFRLVYEWFINMDGAGFTGPDGKWLDLAPDALPPAGARQTTLRQQMIEVTQRVKWVPQFGLERELDWLRNMHDWMISKKRYWGLALPIWKCGKCGNVDVIGSEHELKQRAVLGWQEFEGRSPHRPWVDAVKIRCAKCGDVVSRVRDVGNPWLDAGIVPFSTLKYRHDRGYWKEWYPADWISESFPGQFRNWFYSLLAMSTVLENSEPFRACFTYALMRDERGEEMHKSKGNAIWFDDAAKKMGADVMRWQFSRHTPSLNINFGYGPGDEVRRQFIIPLWNVYSFFVTYANLDGWGPESMDPMPGGARSGALHVPSDGPVQPSPTELDRWLLSELNRLTGDVTRYLEEWRPEAAAHELEEFVDRLSNWYVRRSRRRFWKSESDSDKAAAYATLYKTLTTLCRLLAPFIPFVTEEMYQNLVAGKVPGAPESVHLTDWPQADSSLIDGELSARTGLAIKLASLGRSARASARIKVRQPLRELAVELREPKEYEYLPVIEEQLKDELNVKHVRPAAGRLLTYNIRPNLPALGPKYGKQLGQIRTLLSKADPGQVAGAVERGQAVKLDGFELAPEEVLVEKVAPAGFAVASEAGYAAAVTTEVTAELKSEGTAREVVHLVQNLRKSAGLEISDRISLYVQAPGPVRAALEALDDYVREETLALSVSFTAPPAGAASESHVVEGEGVTIGLIRT